MLRGRTDSKILGGRNTGVENGNFCGRRRRGRGPADGAPVAAGAKFEKQITSGRPPVNKKVAPDGRTDEKKKRKNQSVSQTIDLVETIKTHTGSSKSELSSGGKRPFKVWRYYYSFFFTKTRSD